MENWFTGFIARHDTHFVSLAQNDRILGRVEPLVTRIERRQLARLRNCTRTTVDRGFENVDFWNGPAHERAVIVRRSRVFLAGAGATQ